MTVITHLARSSHFSWVTHAFAKGNRRTKPELSMLDRLDPDLYLMRTERDRNMPEERRSEACRKTQHSALMNIATQKTSTLKSYIVIEH